MLNRLVLSIACAALILGSGCEREPDTQNPRTWSSHALSFEYPGNWKIGDETTQPSESVEIETVTVNSPGDAVMVLTMTRPIGSMMLDDFAAEATKLRAAELERLLGKAEGLAKISKTRSSTRASSIKGSSDSMIHHDFAISVVGEEVPHRGEFHHFEGQEWDVFSYSQAAQEDWDTVQPGFLQVLKSITPK